MTLSTNNFDLTRELHRLQAVTPRPEWKAATRAQLLAHVRATLDQAAPALGWRLSLLWHGVRRTALQPATLLLLLLGLSTSSSLLVNAAYYSVPGDRLYRLKISLESAQLALARDHTKAAELQIAFAQNRLNELTALVARPAEPAAQQARVAQAVRRLKGAVAEVQQQVRTIPSDGSAAFSLALAVDSNASELAANLSRRAKTLPLDVRAGVQEAVDSAESASLSALATAISSTATGTDPIVDNHLADSLFDKMSALQVRLEAASQEARMLPANGAAQAEVSRLLEAAGAQLEQASGAVQGGDFAVALGALSAAKDGVKSADRLLHPAAAVDGSDSAVGATATVTTQMLDESPAPAAPSATPTPVTFPETTDAVLP